MGTRQNLKVIITIAYMVVVVFAACAGKAKVIETTIPEGSIPVTVIDYSELDGCEFLLELNDGAKLQPVNLDEQFKKHGTKLFITYKRYDGVGICMAGTMVTLTSVQKSANK